MDKHTTRERARVLGRVIMAAFLTSAIVIAGAWWKQAIQGRATAVVAAKQAALTEKQREVQGLQNVVATQQTVIQELSSRAGTVQSVEAGPWMQMTATWYSPEGGQSDGTITRSGAPVKAHWTVAVDPRVIPLGSLVEIRYPDGTDRVYRAMDTGSAIRGNRIDVFDWNEHTCLQNGRQTVMVRILVKGGH